MTSSEFDKSQIRYARLAGFMYLLVDAAYLTFALLTARFRVPGDFAETAHRITGSELLYRIGLSSGLVASLGIVFLAIGLYVAIKPLDHDLALLALVFRLLEAMVVGSQAILGFVALKLYMSADSLDAFDGRQLSMFVTLHSTADSVAFNSLAVFFGVGSILFFYLFFRSTYIPKLFMWPQHAKTLQLGWAPIGLAEILVGLWLLFKGLNLRISTAARPLPS